MGTLLGIEIKRTNYIWVGGRDSGWRANVALGEVVVDSRRSQEEVIGTATAPQECTCSQLAAGRTIVIIKEIYTIIWHVGPTLWAHSFMYISVQHTFGKVFI